VKRRLNDSLVKIGYKKIFEIDPVLARDFEWCDEEIIGNNQTDFFHQTPVDYSKNKSIDENDLI
jgi:ribonucleoside-diphosphate reductase beta chain